MEEETSPKPGTKLKKSSHVRFTDAELRQIERDEVVRGLSIPALLKEAYFGGRPVTILLTQEDRKEIVTELCRQGNNLNQITRRANAGIIGNVQQELASIGRALTGMMVLLNGKVLRAKQAR